MDDTPLLARHPLHMAHRSKPKLPQPAARTNSLVAMEDGSETEGVVSSEEEELEAEEERTSKVTEGGANSESDCLEEEDDVPSTQLVDPRPLAGLFIYVDVRSGPDGCENRSAAVSHQLANLGATVCARFTKDITHVVFKDGKITTRERAEKKKVFLVSPLWVEASKRANDRVSEAKYPVLCGDSSSSPVVLGKIKRTKSMQPKPLEEEITRSLGRSRKRHKTDDKALYAKRRALPALPSATTPLSSSVQSPFDFDDEESSNSQDEDNFELPSFKLPGTPVTESEGEGGRTPGGDGRTPVMTGGGGRTPRGGRTPLTTGEGRPVAKAVGKKGGQSAAPRRQSSRRSGQPGEELEKEEEGPSRKSGESKRVRRGGKEKTDGELAATKKAAAIKQPPSNSKASKVPKKTPPTKKKTTPLVHLPAGKENADTTPELKESKEREMIKRRRRVQHKSGGLFERKKPTLVLTSVQPEDQDLIVSVVDKLGRFEVSRTVDENTTHVVCGSPRRTINILAATAMGCWVLSTDWVWKSVESGHWLDEEPYEMADHFPAARLYRLERQTAGLLFRPHLFSPAGSVFISSSCCNPPSQQLEKLLSLAGGKVTGSQRKADVCVGGQSWNKEVKSVTELWILDSITEHQLLPVEDYLLDNPQSRAGSPEL